MIKIICLGKIKESYLIDATSDYCKRINKFHKIEITSLKDETNLEINKGLELEKDKILKIINNKDYVVVLDILGNNIDSIEFSNLIDKSFILSPNLVFVIGSSHGLHQDIKDRANKLISFSNLTFPHQLFRVMLLEQIYRSFKILNNEEYHK